MCFFTEIHKRVQWHQRKCTQGLMLILWDKAEAHKNPYPTNTALYMLSHETPFRSYFGSRHMASVCFFSFSASALHLGCQLRMSLRICLPCALEALTSMVRCVSILGLKIHCWLSLKVGPTIIGIGSPSAEIQLLLS